MGHELGTAQFGWLNTGANLIGNGKTHNFFFHHEPAYGTAARDAKPLKKVPDKLDAPCCVMDNKKRERDKYIQLIGANNARIIFSGHEHQYTKRRINQTFANLGINKERSIVILATPYDSNTGPRTAESWNGDPSAAPLLHIKYDDGTGEKTYEARIRASDDDAEEHPSGGMSLTSSDLEFMKDNAIIQSHVGMRWTHIPIPQGADITSAYIQFTAEDIDSDVAGVTFYGEDTDYALPFTGSANDLSSRIKTSASVDWTNILAWDIIGESVREKHRTPDLEPIIQEIVNRPNWHDDLTFNGEFFEIKAASAGAPWYEYSYEDYRLGFDAYVIELTDPWEKDVNEPYHFAVLDVNGNEVSNTVVAYDRTQLIGPLQAQHASRLYKRLTNAPAITTLEAFPDEERSILIDIPNRGLARSLDTDQDGATDIEESGQDVDNDNMPDYEDLDTARVTTATGAGKIVLDLLEDQYENIQFSDVSTTTDTDLALDQQSKPNKDFPMGLLGFNISGIPMGESLTVIFTFPTGIHEAFSYYSVESWTQIEIGSHDGDNRLTTVITDGGVGDRDGEADGVITHLGGIAEPKPYLVNSMVSMYVQDLSFNYDEDTESCIPIRDFDLGYEGNFLKKFNFTTQLNNIGTIPLSEIILSVRVLTNENILENAEMAPGGEGSGIILDRQGSYQDGKLSPGESVDVPFTICLRDNKPFSLFVDIQARLPETVSLPDEVAPIELFRAGDLDGDGDGIRDDEDDCLNSDLSSTVFIGDYDSGVENMLLDDGCTISDRIMLCAEYSKNHGRFVSCVSRLSNDLKKDGILSNFDKRDLMRCASRADIP